MKKSLIIGTFCMLCGLSCCIITFRCSDRKLDIPIICGFISTLCGGALIGISINDEEY